METHSSSDARRSLETIGASRQEIAGRLVSPWWYYPVLALLMAQLVLAYALLSQNLVGVSLLLMVIGSLWVRRIYARRAGVVSRVPATLRGRLVAALFALGFLVPASVAIWVDNLPVGTVVLLALAALVSTSLLGPALDAVYRADLRRSERLT